MKLSNLSIKSKLVSIVILSVVLLVMASTFNLMQQRASSMQERQDKLSVQVETAVSLASYYYKQRNVLGEEVAQIAVASEQQSTVATEMSESVTGIHLAANEVMQASQSLAEDSQKMANTTEHLTEQLKYFKV